MTVPLSRATLAKPFFLRADLSGVVLKTVTLAL